MPLDTSSYSLALLRLDGRRWNELRRIQAQISTQAAADGSSYLETGNTKVICVVNGPAEGRKGGGGGGGQSREGQDATIEVNINVAGFSQVDRRKRGRTDKRVQEMQHCLEEGFRGVIQTQLFPRSTVVISLHVLADDGGLLAALVNAATLALIDAGIPMTDYLCACTAGCTVSAISSGGGGGVASGGAARGVQAKPSIPGLSSGNYIDDVDDPLLDLSSLEEQELPFLTVATVGASDRVAILMMETRAQISRLEEMLAVGVDGCARVKKILDGVVREHGRELLEDAG